MVKHGLCTPTQFRQGQILEKYERKPMRFELIETVSLSIQMQPDLKVCFFNLGSFTIFFLKNRNY